jgi:hypothetical protein
MPAYTSTCPTCGGAIVAWGPALSGAELACPACHPPLPPIVPFVIRLAGQAPTPERTEVRTCRVCGCTDDDCGACADRTGAPCAWVEDDLCSACVDDEDTEEDHARFW